MKKNYILAAAIAMLSMAFAVSAQKTSDFSGTWNLDVAKSKPAERGIEGQTMVVTQTAATLKVERTTKRSADAGGPGGGGGGGGRGGAMGGGDGTTTYNLDGKAVESEMTNPMGSMKVTTKAKLDGGKLEVTRTIATPMGDRTSTEKWWLNADGTLSVESQRPNRDGGTDTVTRTYVKKA